jgi:hypothetical protein
LIARQGSLKEWHFAHQSKNVQSETKKACEYSFAVSVRLMIRQLAMSDLKFHTPKLTVSIEGYSERSYMCKRIDLAVTEERQITLTRPEVDAKFSETNVDILGYVDEIPFVVYIKHKDRLVPPELDPPCINKCGVVAIDIGGLPVHFEKEKGGRYIDVLRNFIEESPEGKSWVYHPRSSKIRKQAEASMELWLSEQQATPPIQWNESAMDISIPGQKQKSRISKPPERKVQNYRCIMCNAYWSDVSPHCEICDTHLFARVVNGNSSET